MNFFRKGGIFSLVLLFCINSGASITECSFRNSNLVTIIESGGNFHLLILRGSDVDIVSTSSDPIVLVPSDDDSIYWTTNNQVHTVDCDEHLQVGFESETVVFGKKDFLTLPIGVFDDGKFLIGYFAREVRRRFLSIAQDDLHEELRVWSTCDWKVLSQQEFPLSGWSVSYPQWYISTSAWHVFTTSLGEAEQLHFVSRIGLMKTNSYDVGDIIGIEANEDVVKTVSRKGKEYLISEYGSDSELKSERTLDVLRELSWKALALHSGEIYMLVADGVLLVEDGEISPLIAFEDDLGTEKINVANRGDVVVWNSESIWLYEKDKHYRVTYYSSEDLLDECANKSSRESR